MKPQPTELEELTQHIDLLTQQHADAARSRIGDMSNEAKRQKVSDLQEDLQDSKKLRITLIQSQRHQESLERSANYQAKKDKDAADLKARGVRLRRLDEALEALVVEYFSLNPGSYCLSHITNQLDLIKGRIVNEARRQ